MGYLVFVKVKTQMQLLLRETYSFQINEQLEKFWCFMSRNKRNTRCIPFVPCHKTPEFLQLFINL